MKLTYKACIHTDEATAEILKDVLYSATKLYNGLLWHLREEFKRTGKSQLGAPYLNQILQTLPRKKAMYADCAQQIFREIQWAYKSFFALREAGKTDRNAPGFRKKTLLSPIRYPRVNTPKAGAKVFRRKGKTHLHISLGTQREDGIRFLQFRIDLDPRTPLDSIQNLQITYDALSDRFGARLVCEVEGSNQAPGTGSLALDLGETWLAAGVFDDGEEFLLSGRHLKSIRRYWKKVRTHVKPPSEDDPHRSRRYAQISRKESRQIRHLLHIASTHVIERCVQKGVGTIYVGELTDIREDLDYGKRMNQRLHAWPWRIFTDILTYKGERVGISVVPVSERDTSRTCPKCGIVKKSNRMARGVYRCSECGFEHHADLVGARNILTQNVSAVSSSGSLAEPVVLRRSSHTVHEPATSRTVHREAA